MDEDPISLPTELVHNIFSFLSSNEVATTCRLISKNFCCLSSCRVNLRDPVPSHAFQAWFLENAPGFTHDERVLIFTAVSASGCLISLQFLLLQRCVWNFRCFVAAASSDKLEVLQWLLIEGCPVGENPESLEILLAAARHASPTVLRWTARVLRCKLTPNVFEAAAAGHHHQWREKLDWLLQNGCPWDAYGPMCAARHGRIDVLAYLDSRGIKPTATCHATALAAGHIGVCTWLEERGVDLPRGNIPFVAAAGGDQLTALRWLIETRGCSLAAAGGLTEILQAAAASGSLEILSYILQPQIGREYSAAPPAPTQLTESLLVAAVAGRFSVVRHLLESYDLPLTVELTAAVAGAEAKERLGGGGAADGEGKMDSCADILRWLLSKGCPVDCRAVMRALLRGDISAADVAYAASPVGAFREAAMVEVARRGSLVALRWLAAHGGPLGGTKIIAAAARSGTLGKVVWLHIMRCDWDPAVFLEAVASGSRAMITWLAEKHCPMGRSGVGYLVAGLRPDGPDWEVLTCLSELGCPWGEDTLLRAGRGTVSKPWATELLTWMVANGCPAHPQALQEIADAHRRLDLLSLLDLRPQQA